LGGKNPNHKWKTHKRTAPGGTHAKKNKERTHDMLYSEVAKEPGAVGGKQHRGAAGRASHVKSQLKIGRAKASYWGKKGKEIYTGEEDDLRAKLQPRPCYVCIGEINNGGEKESTIAAREKKKKKRRTCSYYLK